jgi:excisionase family DNA binding protein
MKPRDLTGASHRRDRAARPEQRPEVRPEAHTVDTLWDIAGVAAYLRVSADAIYKMTARNAAVPIPHIRIGARLRFRRSDVDRWLTLLTVSNLTTLARMRKHAEDNAHGDDQQTPSP